MKQRLLLALLMLLTSAGFMKAASGLTITIPAGTGTVKIDITGSTGAIIDDTGNGGTKGTSISIAQDPDKVISSRIISVSDLVETMTVTGKVTSFSLDHNGLQTLTFSSNGELTSLTLGSATAKTQVNADGNKVKYVSIASPDVVIKGNQTIDGTTVGFDSFYANGIDIIKAFTEKVSNSVLVGGGSGDYTVTDWQKYNESTKTYSAATDVKNIATSTANPGNVSFFDANRYYTSGTYKCKITKGQASVTLEGIVVKPAKVEITVVDSPKNAWDEKMGGIEDGGITSVTCAAKESDASLSGATYNCHQGDQIKVTATAETNYLFDKFVFENGGLNGNQPSTGSSMTNLTVQAKASEANPQIADPIKIQAVFKGKPCKITYTEDVLNGKYIVQDVIAENDYRTVSNGSEVEYGHKLMITATPDDKFYPQYQLNATDPAAPNTLNTDFKVKNIAYVKVVQNTAITVRFDPNSIDSKYSFVLECSGITATTWSEIFSSITAESSNNSVVLSGNVTDVAKFSVTPSFSAAKNIPMTIVLKTQHSSDYVIQSVQLGKDQVLDLVETTPGTYNTTFNAPEEGDAVFTIKVAKRNNIVIYVPKADGSKEAVSGGGITNRQRYEYDGNPKAFAYSTLPSNLTLSLQYARIENGSNPGVDGSYTTEAPVEVGSYAVKFSRKADNQYAALGETSFKLKTYNTYDVLMITEAPVKITTVPTISVVEKDGSYSYSIGTNGVATALGKTVTGKYELIDEVDINDDAAVKGASVVSSVANTTTSHTVYLRFTVQKNGVDDPNYKPVAVQTVAKVGSTSVATHKVTITTESGKGIKDIKIFNGAQELNATAIPEGTKIKFRASVDNYTLQYQETKAGATPVPMTYISGNTFESGEIEVTADLEYRITTVGDALKARYAMALKNKAQQSVYNGEAQAFDLNQYLVIKKDDQVVSVDDYKTLIYFKDGAGNIVNGYPVDADMYDVCLDIPMIIDNTTPANNQAAQQLVVENAFQITQKAPKVTWPASATLIGKGQSLGTANLRGGSADVPGEFTWSEPSRTDLVSGQYYDITFTPDDQKNYKTVSTGKEEYLSAKGLTITVSEFPILAIDEVPNGYFSVTSEDGKSTYYDGNQIPDGTKVKITAVPNQDFEVEALSINECGTIKNISSGSIYTFAGKSIQVTGSFKVVKEEPDVEIDPNSQYTVTVTKSLRGAVISKPGVNAVKKDQSFSFTVTTLPADASKIKVTAGGSVITPSSTGVYTIAKVTSNMTVDVSFTSAPTALTIDIPREYKNEGGYLVGRVQVEGPSDGKCYYNDEITLVAFPESGVKFTRWTGDKTSSEQVLTIVLTGNLEMEANFSGTPTGIEDIMAASITTGRGYVWVRGIANADVTIVSISGRVQARQRISGDTQINVPAGIYVVVLESGSDVKRTKVIVK